jgi:HipA-like protein
MTDALVVVLEDLVAGTVTRLRGGRLRFDYSRDYLARSGRTQLSLSMPTPITTPF